MKSFLCRVMTLIFLFNCLTPATGWGQTARRQNKSRSMNDQLAEKVENAQQKTPADQFARADKKAREAHNSYFEEADTAAAQNKKMDALRQQPAIAEQTSANSLYVAPRTLPQVTAKQADTDTSAKNFLKRLSRNDISFEELVTYVDPLQPDPAANDLLTTAYAAEVIGNTVSEAMQLDTSLYDINEFQEQLTEAQARLLWRLALLGDKVPSYKDNPRKDPDYISRTQLQNSFSSAKRRTMAVASLRMALLKIHQFYQAKNLPDPVDEYQKEMAVRRAVNLEKIKRQQVRNNDKLVVRFTNGLGDLPNQFQIQASNHASVAVKNRGNLATFMKQFIDEFEEAMQKEPEQGTYDYEHAQIKAEYAAAYALEYDPVFLTKIVDIVDQGPKETDFKQDYSPILNAIFITVFENTRYSNMSAEKTKKVLTLLSKFSDPEKYSLPTRVFALEAASLLFRPFNQDSFNTLQEKPSFNFFAPVNFNKPDDNLRRLFAQRVADLYCPLVAKNSKQMEDYGLGSDEMEALANKLGYMYDGFYDIHTQMLEDNTKPAGRYARDFYPYTQCYVTMHGNLNMLKKTNERVAAFLYFSAEVIFWIYGGDVFALLGTAFRLTRGAVVALPKAHKAFTLAARGEKMAAFNAEISKGAKYANWIYKNKKQQGYTIEAIVQKAPAKVEKETVVRDGVEETVERQIQAAVVEYKPVTTTHQLAGKYSLWNPKRWLGIKRGEEIVGYRVTRTEPGFKATVGQVTFGAPIDGLHSLQEIAQMTRQLKMADGSRFWFERQPYWRGMLNVGQAQQERWTLDGMKMAFKNQMDLWIPLGKTAQETGKISETTRWWNVTQWGWPREWGELVEAKMWGKIGEGGTSAQMPIYVAPKTPIQFTWRGTSNQLALRQEGVANISEVLPGFYTSGADLASENVYRQMFNAYMKPLNWEKIVPKTLLPDYLPTSMFWKSVRANPVLGAQLVPQLLWRNRFASTTVSLGMLFGADYLGYFPFKSWMTDQAEKDYWQEMSKYGNTFSEKRAKLDELLLKDMGTDLSDNRQMDTWEQVQTAQPDEADGTLITAPIIMARRALGMEFIDDASKGALESQARKTNLNRAFLQRAHTIVEQNKQIEAQNKESEKQLRQALAQDEQQILTDYRLGFAALPGTQQKLHDAYEQYAQEALAARTEEQVEEAKKHFNQTVQPLFNQVATYHDYLMEANKFIQQSREKYASVPGFFTAKHEKQIRDIYKAYAQEILAIDLKQSKEVQISLGIRAQHNLNYAIQMLGIQMQEEYAAKQPGYGSDFDPDAAE